VRGYLIRGDARWSAEQIEGNAASDGCARRIEALPSHVARPQRLVERRNEEASRLRVTRNGAPVIEGCIPVPSLQEAGFLGQRAITSGDNPEGIDVLPEVSGAKRDHSHSNVGDIDAEGIELVVGRCASKASGIPCGQWLRCQRLAALAIHVGTFDV